MDLLVPQSSGGTADGRRLTALTVRVFEIPGTPPPPRAEVRAHLKTHQPAVGLLFSPPQVGAFFSFPSEDFFY